MLESLSYTANVGGFLTKEIKTYKASKENLGDFVEDFRSKFRFIATVL